MMCTKTYGFAFSWSIGKMVWTTRGIMTEWEASDGSIPKSFSCDNFQRYLLDDSDKWHKQKEKAICPALSA